MDHLDPIMNKIGLGSITTTIGIKAAEAQEIIQVSTSSSWGLTEYALLLSIIGSILFCIDKALVIYIRVKNKKSKE